MLMKQANPEHADSSPGLPDNPAMDLDPSIQDTTADANQTNNILDDVFGDDDGGMAPDRPRNHEHHQESITLRPEQHHPSDIPRLQQEHTTAGYRDGITVAKATSIQSGFDEGFGLGATIGLKTGRLLGLLEGIAAATAGEEEALLLNQARTELGVRSVFGEAFWNVDGTWKYEVEELSSSADGAEADVLFSHVAEAHPLVKKWTATVEGEMRQRGLREQLPLLARHDDEDERIEPAVVLTRAKATGQSQSEAKAPSDALSW